MNKLFISSPHNHDGSSVSVIMLSVGLALLPGLACYVRFFGWGIVVQCLLAVIFALTLEYLMLKLKRRPAKAFLMDGSAVVTGLLFALTISPLSPWWITLSGIAFAIIVAKHLYGGLGHNLFNPAMAGYVFVLLCFPAQMNIWPTALENPLTLVSYLQAILGSEQINFDAISGATVLGDIKSQLGSMSMISEIRLDPIYGHYGGLAWEWVSGGFMLGGIALLLFRVIQWQIPVATLAGIVILSIIFNFYDIDIYAPASFHLFSGGTFLCAFFIASDPVTASTTPAGRLIYGCLIGILIYLIRVWGDYPDGVAFAVLGANALVPLIDYYTRPSVIGETHNEK